MVNQSTDEVSSSTTIGENSDSLYQMLQEYMVENQHLKEENDKLKIERDDFVEKLDREKTTNEKITREVLH